MTTAPPTTPDAATIVDADEEAALAWLAGLLDREADEMDRDFERGVWDYDADAEADRAADRYERNVLGL